MRAVDIESPLRIVLVQGIARGEKMDWILQKATELGVAGFVPVSSDRSEVKLAGERAGKRAAHWRSVVVSACEQSGRATIPGVAAPIPLAHAMAALPAGALRLLLDPQAAQDMPAQDIPPPGLVLPIGPEVGWSVPHLAHFRATENDTDIWKE